MLHASGGLVQDAPRAADVRRTMFPRRLPLMLLCAALAILAVPAAASAATPKYPTIKKVSPLSLRIGERLTIQGTGFLAGKNRNTVVFKAPGRRAIFAKAQLSTTKKMFVTVPAKL